MKTKTMKHRITTAFWMTAFSTVLLAATVVQAQDRIPREFVDPNELVSFNGETSMQQAFQILNVFARQYKDKIIINRTNKSGPIGVEIPNMPWFQALEYITNYNNMVIREFPEHYELTEREVFGPGPAGAPQGVAGAVADVSFETREVEITATFFEGDKNYMRQLGIDWSIIKGTEVAITNRSASYVTTEVLDVDVNWGDIIPGMGSVDINTLLSTFEEEGKGRVLATPKIKVMEGKAGRVQVGQDISIKQRDFAGNVIDRFFSTGTILDVTPQVIVKGDTPFIFLTLRAERSTAVPDPQNTVINKQEAASEVLLLSGETTVIAGLFETQNRETRRGIPILKDLPPWFFGLRYLFGYEAVESSEYELIVVLTARLVPTLEERVNQRVLTVEEQVRGQQQRFRTESGDL
ncbi:MAG: type II secretion system protein GspD [Cyclonatronaceae bacterium]